jgi:6-phosphogluconolactonase
MLKIFNNNNELAIAFCNELMKLSSDKEKLFIVLSGGSTPQITFQTLANNFVDKIDWRKIHLFWGDERCVSPENEESNFGMTNKYLLKYIDIPDKNVHRIKGENDPQTEAVSYAEEVKQFVPFKGRYPQFDLLMLGIGEDGHTASIFPDQMHLLKSDKICEVAVHPKSGQKRITLTGKTINNSKRVIFLVAGKNKAEIIRLILQEKAKASNYPAAHIKPVNGSLEFYIDQEAAKLIKQSHQKVE